jgi:pyruvate dehydrogenase E2 component (dihydrolipoamide acetyltransferase)
MAVKIVIPREGQEMESALIAEWFVKVGDTVSFGDELCEVESEKASFPIESPVAGTVLAVFYEKGDDAPVLETIAVIGKPGEDYEHLKPGAEKTAPGDVEEQKVEIPLSEPAEPSKSEQERSQRKKMSPKAKMLAKKRNKAKSNSLSGMRKTIAEKMLSSVQSSAQFTLYSFADATNLLEQYQNVKADSNRESKISLNDVIMFVTIKTLMDFTDLNAHFENMRYTKYDEIHLGFAVDVQEGLMVPVMKNAQSMNLDTLSEKAAVLIENCRSGNIRPEDLQGGTFTISNLGMFGIEKFSPILNYPEVAILGVGGIFPRPIRKEKEIDFIDCIELSLTLNHQIIDGVLGAKFLQTLAKNIKEIHLD